MSFPVGPFRRLPQGGGGRISPYLPLSFPNLELYLDSRLGLSSFSDTSDVTTWPDQSGHSPTRDAVTNVSNPKMGRSGANLTPRGAPSVVWGVANDAQGLQSSLFTWPDPGTRGWTVYWYGLTLAKTTPAYSFTNQVVWAGDSANVHYQQLVDSGTGIGGSSSKYGFVDDGGGGNPKVFGSIASIANAWKLHTVVLPSPNNNTVPGRYYLNGVLQTQTGGGANYKVTIAGNGAYALGNTTGFNVAFKGNLGAMIWYSDTHTQAQISLFNLWANLFFGLS